MPVITVGVYWGSSRGHALSLMADCFSPFRCRSISIQQLLRSRRVRFFTPHLIRLESYTVTRTHTHTHTQQLGRLIVQLWTIIDRFETARGAFLMKRQRCRRRAVFRFPHSISTRLGFPGSSSSSSSSSSSVMAKFSHGE